MTTVKRVDLDELEKANSHIERWEAVGEVAVWDVKGSVTDVLSSLIAELRAARKVVDACRKIDPLVCAEGLGGVDSTLAEYDALFEEGT